jgi:CheY-like chemotaxis protein
MAEVLLVDDDSSVLITLSIALRRRGHEVTVACDGQQALSQMARQSFDFLVTDIRMPGMSGLELARRANAEPRPPQIVLTSAHYDPTIAPNPASQVAEAFLSKPIDVDQLNELLGKTPPAPPPPSREPEHRVMERRTKPRPPNTPFFGSRPIPQPG